MKGLAVVDDIAYFGISPQAPRSARDDPKHNNDIAAFDLISGNLLWHRTVGRQEQVSQEYRNLWYTCSIVICRLSCNLNANVIYIRLVFRGS